MLDEARLKRTYLAWRVLPWLCGIAACGGAIGVFMALASRTTPVIVVERTGELQERLGAVGDAVPIDVRVDWPSEIRIADFVNYPERHQGILASAGQFDVASTCDTADEAFLGSRGKTFLRTTYDLRRSPTTASTNGRSPQEITATADDGLYPGSTGHFFRLASEALEKSWGKCRATHLALLMRNGNEAPVSHVQLEIERETTNHALNAVIRLDDEPRWRWYLVELNSFAMRDRPLEQFPADGKGIAKLNFTYRAGRVFRSHGTLDIARISLVQLSTWNPDLYSESVITVTPGEAVTRHPSALGEIMLFEMSGDEASAQPAGEYGGFQSDGGISSFSEVHTRRDARGGYFALRYDAGLERRLVGHYFKIDSGQLRDALKRHPLTHVEFTLRVPTSTGDPPQGMRIELKSDDHVLCASVPVPADAFADSEWVRLRVPKTGRLSANTLSTLGEIVFVFEPREVDRTSGEVHLQRITFGGSGSSSRE